MSSKKTGANKSLRQLADSLPRAYEMHRSGGEKAGKLSEELRAKYSGDKKELIYLDPAFPKGCIIMPDHISLWRPHLYKARINHYRRLRNAYALKGMAGVTEYLADIRKAQLERVEQYKKDKDAKDQALQQQQENV